MTTHPTVLAPFYAGWEAYQRHLVEALAPLSPDQLALRAAPHLRSVGMLATHLIGVRAGWLYYVLEERDERLVALDQWSERDLPVRSAAELVGGLETTWQVIQSALDRWTVADLSTPFHYTNDNGEKEVFTLQWVIWHLIEHDLHHGGELSFMLGMHHIPTINL